MQKAIDNFLFGLCFGMGFALAGVILKLLASLLSQGAK